MAAQTEIKPHLLKQLKRTNRTIDQNGMEVLIKRYLIKDPVTNEITETPDEMFRRVAARVASIDINVYDKSEKDATDFAEELYTGMKDQRFILAGRNLVAWNTVPNCVVMEIKEDTTENWETLRIKARKAQEGGCGLGFPMHQFKPTMDKYEHRDLYSPGPVARLMQLNSDFSNIIQNSRNGANMACMLVTHPDILEFIDCKRVEGSIESFNISVMLTDEFMEQATDPSHPKYNEPWKCYFEGREYPLRKITRKANKFDNIKIEPVLMTAAQILMKIIKNSYLNGEPGFLYPDAANATNPLPDLGPLQATNPCGEQWLHSFHSCLLMAVNVDRYWSNDYGMDWKQLDDDVALLVHAGDNIVDMFKLDVEEIITEAKKSRRLGIGVMGIGDLFISMNLRYGSSESIAIAEDISKRITNSAIKASEKLAEVRGEFEYWPLSSFAKQGLPKRRNAAVTNVAPTGSTAKIFGASTGVEPIYSFAYNANVVGKKLRMVNQRLMDAINEVRFETEEIRHHVIERIMDEGSIQNIPEIPQSIKDVFVCAGDISPTEHIKMQASFQKYIENAISKTTNLPNSATEHDIRNVITLAWRGRCKGCTVYRDGSRQFQVLTTKAAERISSTLASSTRACLECGTDLINEEGCHSCPNPECGWSGCDRFK